SERHHTGRAQRIPYCEPVLIAHMQFPALFADIGNAEGHYLLAGYADRPYRGEGEIFRRQSLRILNDLLQGHACIGPPATDGDIILGDIRDGYVKALILGHALHIVEVAGSRIGSVHYPATVRHAEYGKIGSHHALIVEEVGIDALADVVVA